MFLMKKNIRIFTKNRHLLLKILRREVNVCNATALRWVTWTIHKGVQESATPEDISKWITYNNGKAVLDNQAMRD